MKVNEMTQPPRFIVLGAKTMLELVDMMNKTTYPIVQLKYFGINVGDYTGYINEENLKAAIVIAVFDAMPTPIADINDMEITDDFGSFGGVSGNSDIAMTA